MKIALIGDTHGYLVDPPADVDAIIHVGDIARDYKPQQWWNNDFQEWLLAHRVPIFATLGNHDIDNIAFFKEMQLRSSVNFNLIIDDWATIGDKKVWFSPWSPRFGHWNWMQQEWQLAQIYATIHDDVNVVVSHTPPYSVLDETVVGEHVGSHALLDRLAQLSELEIVVCGHIHEARGMEMIGTTQVYNVSAVDEFYHLRVDPYVIVEW